MSEIVGIGVDMIEISRVLAAYSKVFENVISRKRSSSLLLAKKLVRQRPLLQKKLS